MLNIPMPTIVILDEADAAKLLRMLYNGQCPERVHTLICLCGQVADLRTNAKAWNGWQILPHAKCPRCIETSQAATIQEMYPELAHERFMQLIGEIGS